MIVLMLETWPCDGQQAGRNYSDIFKSLPNSTLATSQASSECESKKNRFRALYRLSPRGCGCHFITSDNPLVKLNTTKLFPLSKSVLN